MVSFQPALFICMLAIGLGTFSQGAENRYSERFGQRGHPFQRPLSSHFRQRLGFQGSRNNHGNFYSQSSNNNNYYAPSSHNERDGGYSASSGASSYGGGASSSYGGGASSSYGGGASYGGGEYAGGYDSGLNPLAALVAPLAALALLGAAAAVATNPVLLTIAVLSSGRKRRDLEEVNGAPLTPELSQKLHEMEVLEKYIAKVPQEQKQQEKLMATYLSCSGYTESDNFCLDRVVCEYSVLPSKMPALEKDVVSIVLYNIMSNTFVPKEFKERLRTAAQYGRNRGQCSAFVCNQLTKQ